MARTTWAYLPLLSVAVLAAQAYPADTGMLYVKSFPAGATVVIGGEARGKTPVLVRDLAAGDVAVEFRIAGVKPVTKVATVKANKVATIDVTIEIPRATLTVVSEPLEATVILDGRDAGKTPTTLEHLDPGPHELVLLKDGHPRTTRSVVLEPGAERVLEVKLGTAGGDETVRPAAGESVARAAKSVPVEVQLIFTMLKDTVAKGNHSETRRNLALALSQPDMADFKEELCAAIRVVEALETRQRHVRKGAEALVGREVVLRTKTGPRSGKVEGVSFEGIALASKIMVEGAPAGETRGVIKWTGLAPAEQDRLAKSWKPEGLDGAVARVILAQARKDRAAAERAATGTGGSPLGKYLQTPAVVSEPGSAEAAWGAIERRAQASTISVAEGRRLLRLISEFKERHGASAFAKQLGERLAETESEVLRASAKSAGVPADAVEFGGHYYKLYRQKVSWKMAKGFCDRARGHLVTLTSLEENQAVVNMCQGQTDRVWTGFTDVYAEGRWQWLTGEKVGFTKWAPGQPDNLKNEDYGSLVIRNPSAPGRTGMWNDLGLKARVFFVCEWDIAPGVKGSPSAAGAWPRE